LNKRIFLLLIFNIFININQVFAGNYKTINITDFRVEPPPKTDHKSGQIKNLSSHLDRLYKLHTEKKEYIQFARQSDLQLVEDRVVTTILSHPGTTTADIDGNNLKVFGVRIQAKAKHSMSVEIPISELKNVSTSIEGLGVITTPLTPKEHAVTSEGVALMNADYWHSVGDSGSGVKVAVIDGGFDSLTEAQTSGDIPASYVSQDFTGSGLQTGTPHGTAVAEAIFDVAPKAELYLYKIANPTHLENAKDSCISNGVDIINHSMGWFNASYYDGTGLICGITDDAISNGICWVNSAGNEAQTHYRSVFSDAGDDSHDFSGSGGNINYFGPGTGPAYNIPAGYTIDVFLNWDAYPTTTEDYDLTLYYWNGGTWVPVASSANDQTSGAYPYPTERISHVAANTGPYGVVVWEDSTTMDHDFTLFNWIAPFNYQTASSSVTDPASATDVISVGAIDSTDYTSGPQQDFSSQGPTTDGRTKPDVAAPDDCISHAYGYWTGTSLSSPHTAGVCALLKSRFPGYSNSEIRNYLYTNCTVDLGTLGKDNIYGWGKVEMPDIALTVTSPNGGEDFQVDSVHNVAWTSSGTSGGVRIEYSINNGESWSDVIASVPDSGVYPWTIPDTPSDSCLVRIADTNGSLADTSDAMFAISPIPYITVSSPNGGEDFQVDSIHNVTWASIGTSGGVLIQYSTDSGSNWSDVITVIPDTGVYPWTIPDTPSDSCLLRIADTNKSLADTSDAMFTIFPIPYITITAPNGGEDWGRGYSYDITWTSTGTSGGVRIEYSTDYGESWLDVIAVIPDTGAYPWTIPTDTTSDSCLVRISDTTGSPADTSDSIFAIVSVTSTPIPKLPEVYSLDTKGINAGNLFEIKYALPEKAKFKLEVYDIKGTKIKGISEENRAGFYSIKINMSGKPSGVYFIRMEANGKKFTKTNKVVLVK
jgi:hypothetical protein